MLRLPAAGADGYERRVTNVLIQRKGYDAADVYVSVANR